MRDENFVYLMVNFWEDHYEFDHHKSSKISAYWHIANKESYLNDRYRCVSIRTPKGMFKRTCANPVRFLSRSDIIVYWNKWGQLVWMDIDSNYRIEHLVDIRNYQI
jgi:hypothetical protein